jgi:succinate-acetate transporter protein
MFAFFYTNIHSGQKPCATLLMQYFGGFFGLTAVVVYGNFWYDFVPFIAGSESCAREDLNLILIVHASIFVSMGIIAFLLEYNACGSGRSTH